MIYLDNAATTFPKPDSVISAVTECMQNWCANPGRAGHKAAMKSGEAVYDTRSRIADLIGAKSDEIIFSANCTDALNTAVHGVLRPGDHVITTMMEHNSVLRPLNRMKKQGVATTVVWCDRQGKPRPEDIRAAIRRNTRMIICTMASNVTGTVMPLEEIGKIARRYGLLFLVDGSQGMGVVEVDVDGCGIDMIAASGHKSLMGPQGTGFLYVRRGTKIRPVREGGTGTESKKLRQPDRIPEGFEAGTVNVPGIAGLGAGIKYISDLGIERIRKKEEYLTACLEEELRGNKEIITYGPAAGKRKTGIFSFNIRGIGCEKAAEILDQEYGIAVRAGFHCAPLAHKAVGTQASGCVRISVGPFNTENEMTETAECIKKIAAESQKYRNS